MINYDTIDDLIPANELQVITFISIIQMNRTPLKIALNAKMKCEYQFTSHRTTMILKCSNTTSKSSGMAATKV
jgi:hypothetical protein